MIHISAFLMCLLGLERDKFAFYLYLAQYYTNIRRLVGVDIKIWKVRSHIFRIIIVVFFRTNNFTRTEQKERHDGEVHGSLHSGRSSVWSLLHLIPLAPTVWRWFLDFWGKKCGNMP
jgi:hypothetical protein